MREEYKIYVRAPGFDEKVAPNSKYYATKQERDADFIKMAKQYKENEWTSSYTLTAVTIIREYDNKSQPINDSKGD